MKKKEKIQTIPFEKPAVKTRLRDLARKFFSQGLGLKKNPPQKTINTFYCRTAAFYEEAVGQQLSHWLEAYENESGYWTLVKKTKLPDIKTKDESLYEGVVISTKMTFKEAIEKMHDFEQGSEAIGSKKTEFKAPYEFKNAAWNEGYNCYREEITFDSSIQRRQKPEKKDIRPLFSWLSSIGRRIEDANTEEGLCAERFFEDEVYRKSLSETKQAIEKFLNLVDGAISGISHMIDAKNGKQMPIDFAEPDNEYTFKFPHIGRFDYHYGANTIDRCIYHYGEGEWDWTGPFAVEKYLRAAQDVLESDLGFLAEEEKVQIRGFFLELNLASSTVHASNLYNLPIDHAQSLLNKAFTSEEKIVEQKAREAQEHHTMLLSDRLTLKKLQQMILNREETFLETLNILTKQRKRVEDCLSFMQVNESREQDQKRKPKNKKPEQGIKPC